MSIAEDGKASQRIAEIVAEINALCKGKFSDHDQLGLQVIAIKMYLDELTNTGGD